MALSPQTRIALGHALGKSSARVVADEIDKVADVTAGTQTANKAVIADSNVNTGVSKVTELHIGTSGSEGQVLAGDLPVTAGIGITGTADSFASRVEKFGTLFKTTIVIDIDGLNSGGTADDIIGADGAGVAHLGQITAAANGTIFAGRMTCLETPLTGDNDIDLHSADEPTGVENTGISALSNAAKLCDSGDLTSASIIPMALFPAADQHLYLTGGIGDQEATYTAGILVIELWGK